MTPDPNSPQAVGSWVLILMMVGNFIATCILAYAAMRRQPPLDATLAGKADHAGLDKKYVPRNECNLRHVQIKTIDELEKMFVTRREWQEFKDWLKEDREEAHQWREEAREQLANISNGLSNLAGRKEHT